jgi:hypothetical protein
MTKSFSLKFLNVIVTHFGAPHKQKNKKKKEKILEENKKYISWEEHTKTPRKLPKTGWERSNIQG